MTHETAVVPEVVEPDLFKGLPRRVQIGQYTFRLFVVPPDHEKLGGCDGMTYTGDNKVYLALGNSRQTTLNTVVHELTHCINWARDVTDESDEEAFTTQHTYGLVELWMRNPRVLNWIVKNLRAVKKEISE
jgi:hypothetical protein